VNGVAEAAWQTIKDVAWPLCMALVILTLNILEARRGRPTQPPSKLEGALATGWPDGSACDIDALAVSTHASATATDALAVATACDCNDG
jgi:hypothetical protein